jgi:ryanodine receptor 2
MYKPNPINTDDIKLSADIVELSELIAKNTHEVWAEGRIKDGWVYGEKRDDGAKHHPCLIPYEELTEAEKQYDRNTSIETLKLIIKLGYNITKLK